jgi:hypothetical protein
MAPLFLSSYLPIFSASLFFMAVHNPDKQEPKKKKFLHVCMPRPLFFLGLVGSIVCQPVLPLTVVVGEKRCQEKQPF